MGKSSADVGQQGPRKVIKVLRNDAKWVLLDKTVRSKKSGQPSKEVGFTVVPRQALLCHLCPCPLVHLELVLGRAAWLGLLRLSCGRWWPPPRCCGWAGCAQSRAEVDWWMLLSLSTPGMEAVANGSGAMQLTSSGPTCTAPTLPLPTSTGDGPCRAVWQEANGFD